MNFDEDILDDNDVGLKTNNSMAFDTKTTSSEKKAA